MPFRAMSPRPSPSPTICPRHGEACRYPGSRRPAHQRRGASWDFISWDEWPIVQRVPSGAAVRIRRLARNPAVWFLVGLVVCRLLLEAGLLPPLDWLPGEPRR